MCCTAFKVDWESGGLRLGVASCVKWSLTSRSTREMMDSSPGVHGGRVSIGVARRRSTAPNTGGRRCGFSPRDGLLGGSGFRPWDIRVAMVIFQQCCL